MATAYEKESDMTQRPNAYSDKDRMPAALPKKKWDSKEAVIQVLIIIAVLVCGAFVIRALPEGILIKGDINYLVAGVLLAMMLGHPVRKLYAKISHSELAKLIGLRFGVGLLLGIALIHLLDYDAVQTWQRLAWMVAIYVIFTIFNITKRRIKNLERRWVN